MNAAPFAAEAPTTAALAALEGLFGERFSANESVRRQHGQGEGHATPTTPDAVVYPLSTQEVAEAVRICARHGVPVIAFGAGTSLEGNISAPLGGVTLDMSRMDAILVVNEADLDVTVQAGVTREQLNAHLRDRGLFFPLDPGANATLGGMAATRASGTNAVRYGTMRENVLSLTVALADGRVVTTARRARKSAAGFDLTRLFVGSEGALGVITEVTVRLYGIPEAMSAAVCAFETLDGAVDTVIQTIQAGVPIARVELLDASQVRACNLYSRLDLVERPTLFFEFHGTAAGVAEQSEMVAAIAADNGGPAFAWAVLAEERNALWKARHQAYFAAMALRPGCAVWPTDVCVPISRLTACIHETVADIEATGLTAPIVGHVGDGNFHVNVVVDADSPAEVAEAEAFNHRLVRRALAMDGTCTGEHGIGLGKRDYLIEELGADAADMMRAIKQALDPQGILNPDKVIARRPA